MPSRCEFVGLCAFGYQQLREQGVRKVGEDSAENATSCCYA